MATSEEFTLLERNLDVWNFVCLELRLELRLVDFEQASQRIIAVSRLAPSSFVLRIARLRRS